jgi:hypothetical protein
VEPGDVDRGIVRLLHRTSLDLITGQCRREVFQKQGEHRAVFGERCQLAARNSYGYMRRAGPSDATFTTSLAGPIPRV